MVFLAYFAWLVALLFSDQVFVRGAGNWEIKKLTGESYAQPRFAISLHDHSAAFVSGAYCANSRNGGAPIGYDRSLCQLECPPNSSCVWKLREGFTTESEWQAAVSTEMARLEQDGGTKEEVVGTWIAEAPLSSMDVTDAIIDDLVSSLKDISFHKGVVVSESGDRRYLKVSGTPSSVEGLRSAGFDSLTPIPPRLKVDPMLEEAATAAAARLWEYDDASDDVGLEADPADTIHGLHIQIFGRSSGPSSSSLLPYSNNNNNNATGSAPPPPRRLAQLLSSTWAGMIATRLGHGKAEVVADGDHHITVRGLTCMEELYLVALDIAAHGEVHWVAPQGRLTSSNYFASQVVQSGSWYMPGDIGSPQDKNIKDYSPFSSLGLSGQGQVVGIADTGLDWNSGYFRDTRSYFVDNRRTPSFEWSEEERIANRQEHKYEVWESRKHRKIRQYVAYMNGKEDESEGHGTHVCGSVGGAPPPDDVLNAHYHGVAPDVKIAFFDRYSKTEENGDHMPTELAKHVFPYAYEVGARVYVASFNYGIVNPVYSAMASSLDDYCFTNQDFIVFVSAGNKGSPTSRKGTISTPAEAKNCVTVGSHFNPMMEENSPPPPPGAPDNAARLMVVDPNSAEGPTNGDDKRIKPDVVGPGSSVISAASSLTAPPGHVSSVYKHGTSSANAIVAGAAVLVRQYFTDGYYPKGVKARRAGFIPMGALVKAVLVNSARVVGGTDYQDIEVPNYAQGWGGVDLASTLVTPSSPKGLELKVFGQWTDYCHKCPALWSLTVNECVFKTSADTHQLPLKITLVWHDAKAASGSLKALVNDLDLTVTEKGPTGTEDTTTYYPNGKKHGERDRVNNVEHINIPHPKPSTTYTARLQPHVIAMGNKQPYALVISGPFDSANAVWSIINLPSPKKKKRRQAGRTSNA